MFLFKSIIYFNLISTIILSNELYEDFDELDLHIDPVKLSITVNDTEGIIYCRSRAQINKTEDELTVSIDDRTPILPKFVIKSEKVNSTTIKIRILPNNYIGIGRIICHRHNNMSHGQPADIFIGANPGLIELKEPCKAYDYNYVQCIFNAPNLARAYRYGFPRKYKFTQIQPGNSFKLPPIFVNETDENELIFKFFPIDSDNIPKRTFMNVSMSLGGHGSSSYKFNISPQHTTKVDFQIINVKHDQLTIFINHKDRKEMNPRLCSAHVTQLVDKNSPAEVQDINPTSNVEILISNLRSSANYRICLTCFYDKTDSSTHEKRCQQIRTMKKKTEISWKILLISISIGVILLLLISFVLFTKKKLLCQRKSENNSISATNKSKKIGSSDSSLINLDRRKQEMDDAFRTDQRYPRYFTEPNGNVYADDDSSSLLRVNQISENHQENLYNDDRYKNIDDFMDRLTDQRKISPDTIDLGKQKNVC